MMIPYHELHNIKKKIFENVCRKMQYFPFKFLLEIINNEIK